MNEIAYSEVAPSRGWLKAKSGNREVSFAWPPFQGTHQDCYQAIAQDKELVPAEGLDLAILANGAYTQNTPKWASVKGNFKSNWVRTPNRILWIPKSNELAGILIERDNQGNGLSTKMNIPKDVNGWSNQDGIYVSPDGNTKLVPADKYNLGKVNSKDGFLRAILTSEGAELFVKTAKDSKLVPYTWGLDINGLTAPEQRVSLLGEFVGGLFLIGVLGYCLAFGVSASGEASTPKNKLK